MATTSPRRVPAPKIAHQQRYTMASVERYSWPLSPHQVAEERLHLATDMVFLVLFDGMSLPPRLAQQVQRLFEALQRVQEELGALVDPSCTRQA
jgi:hypothetical protein